MMMVRHRKMCHLLTFLCAVAVLQLIDRKRSHNCWYRPISSLVLFIQGQQLIAKNVRRKSSKNQTGRPPPYGAGFSGFRVFCRHIFETKSQKKIEKPPLITTITTITTNASIVQKATAYHSVRCSVAATIPTDEVMHRSGSSG
ncbi:uncharacterized protein LOC111272439 [Varroa jacobsoni]|nr:uncharacterized protein LOC111272439 [Varroa jacobsoni]